ncbi:unnamed protein product, partial [Vitis vinifera]
MIEAAYALMSRIRYSFSWCYSGVSTEGEHVLDAIGLDGDESIIDFLHRYVGASEMHPCLHEDHILHLVGEYFGTIVLPYSGARVGASKIDSDGMEKGIRNMFFQGVEFWMKRFIVFNTPAHDSPIHIIFASNLGSDRH